MIGYTYIMKLDTPWKLAHLDLPNRVVLAPLADIGNWFVRLQAKRYGAGFTVSQMVSAAGLYHGSEKTVNEYLRIHPDEHPLAIQLFGNQPDHMERAAAMVAESGAEMIDINMGCPVKKVCKTGAGASLLQDHHRALALFQAARRGSQLPVSVKLRSGNRPGEFGGIELAHKLDAAGVAAIALHPRHASQQHKGNPDYQLVSDLAASLDAPLILSGGMQDETAIVAHFSETGADAVMLARGALGNPWLFTRVLDPALPPPTPGEVIRELEWLMERATEHVGDERANRYLRKFYPWYGEHLGLTKRQLQPFVTAPSMQEAREALLALTGDKAEA